MLFLFTLLESNYTFGLQGSIRSCIGEQSRDAIARSDKLLKLWHTYRHSVQTARSSSLLLKLIDDLFDRPYLTFSSAKTSLNVTFRAAQMNVQKLVSAGILEEVPGRKYRPDFYRPPHRRYSRSARTEDEPVIPK